MKTQLEAAASTEDDAANLLAALELRRGYEKAAAADPHRKDIYKKLGKIYRQLYKEHRERGRKFKDVEMDEIPVFANGRMIRFEDVSPRIVNGRTMVPVRKLAETLGATVTWDPASRTVTIATPSGNTVELTIGSTRAKVNGRAATP